MFTIFDRFLMARTGKSDLPISTKNIQKSDLANKHRVFIWFYDLPRKKISLPDIQGPSCVGLLDVQIVQVWMYPGFCSPGQNAEDFTVHGFKRTGGRKVKTVDLP